MLLNNAVSAGVGVVPLVGDLVVAVYKANSRNAHLWVFWRVVEKIRSLIPVIWGALFAVIPSCIPCGPTSGWKNT